MGKNKFHLAKSFGIEKSSSRLMTSQSIDNQSSSRPGAMLQRSKGAKRKQGELEKTISNSYSRLETVLARTS